MAVKIEYGRNHLTITLAEGATLGAVVEGINRALRKEEKFVGFEQENGKKTAVVAADVDAIWEG